MKQSELGSRLWPIIPRRFQINPLRVYCANEKCSRDITDYVNLQAARDKPNKIWFCCQACRDSVLKKANRYVHNPQ